MSRAAAIAALAVDATAVEVIGRLEAAGIDVLLLKGRSLARALYPDGGRTYNDVDLLVPAGRVPAAEQALRELGFVAHSTAPDAHAQEWRRAGGASVDLHATLDGATAPVWPALAEHGAPLDLDGTTVRALDDVGLALHVALHAAQHGGASARTREELALALRTFGAPVWAEAAVLAGRIGATGAFAAGLRLTAEGARVAGALGLAAQGSRTRALRDAGWHPGAIEIDRIVRMRGERLRTLAWLVVPPADLMEDYYPLARRGRRGLVAAYLMRPFRLAAGAPEAVRRWRDAG